MKRILLVLALSGFVSVWAQTTSNFSGTAITGPVTPILSPTTPTPVAITPSPVTSTPTPVTTPGSVTTPSISGGSATTTNTGATNLIASDLTTLLINVEAALAQALPALATFNDNFDFIDVGTGTLSNVATNPATSTVGQNLATNLGTNFLISSTGLSGTMSGTTHLLVVPGFGSFPITRDTLRGLLVLQNDLHRLLPLVDALNGGTNFTDTNGIVPGFGLGIINGNLAATNNLPTTR